MAYFILMPENCLKRSVNTLFNKIYSANKNSILNSHTVINLYFGMSDHN